LKFHAQALQMIFCLKPIQNHACWPVSESQLGELSTKLALCAAEGMRIRFINKNMDPQFELRR